MAAPPQFERPIRAVWRWLLSFLLILGSFAQLWADTQSDSEFLQRMWQPDDGLPNPVVRKILQTKDGFLWLGTDEGLARFDGVKFTEFDRKDYKLKNDRWLVGLTQDSNGAVWGSGANGGLIRFHNGTITQLTTNDGLLDNYVLSTHIDRKGTLWIGARRGLCKYENGKFTILTNEPGLLTEAVRCFTEQPDGTLWIGTAAGVCSYKNGKFDSSLTNILPERSTMAVEFGSDGSMWVGTPYGLSHLKDGKVRHFTSDHGLAHNTVRAVLEDSAGNIWVGTHGGLQRIEKGEFFPVRFRDSSSMETGDSISDLVYDIQEDREGNVWVGTSVGLKRFRPQRFTIYSRENGLPHDQITSVAQGRNGVIWLSTFGGGLSRFEHGKFTTFNTETGLPSNHILSSFEDQEGTLWIGTDLGGLVRYQHGTFKTFRGRNAQANVVRIIHEDRTGQLWIVNNAGAERFDRQKEKFEAPEELRILGIRTMLEDSGGNLWFGSKTGLVRWKNGEVTTFNEKDGLSSDWINALHEDANGTIWIGTEIGGLCRYKNGRFTSYGEAHNFRERIVHILEDASGRLWLGTKNGVFSIIKKDLETFLDGRSESVNVTSYGRADGMKRAQCNGIGQPAGLRAQDGTLWFPTLLGVVTFDPGAVTATSVRPNAVIEQVQIRGKRLDPNTEVKLSPGDGDIEFHYTGLSLTLPERVRFEYMLEGLDTNWHEAGTRRVARYTISTPGDYKFRVRARNNEGLWSKEDDSFDFTISPYFYQTYSFYFLCGVGLVAGSAGFYRLRLRNLKRREQELMGLVSHRTKELQQEIIERKQAERRSSVFSRLGQRLSLATSAEEAAKVIVEAADDLLGWDACILYSYNEQEDKGQPLVFFDIIDGVRRDITGKRRQIDLTPVARRTIKRGAQLILRKEPISSSADYAPFGDTTRMSASLMYVPICKAEKIVGILSIQSYRVNAYAPADLDTLQALADYCGSAFEQIRAEAALRESQQMVLRQERLAAVGQLSAGVAHEFNNILTIIRGHAALLQEAIRDEEATQSLDQISSSAERAANLTRQMLAFSRKQLLQTRMVDLNEITSQVATMLGRLIGENISITCNLQPSLPAVCADPGMIEQVIINLALNARDAMPDGGILNVATSSVTITDTATRGRGEAYTGSFVCLTVSDTGCGMDDSTQEKIFEPFFTTKEVGQGTGLGLATVYGIVKQHQGWVEVSSKLGEGTSFNIFLPVGNNKMSPTKPKEAPSQPKGGKETILFVEDEPDIRQLARQVLEHLGYAVLEAGSGVEALKLWPAHKEEIKLLLTDMVMPEGISGGELARRLRAEKPELRVIYMSGYSVEILEKDLSDQKDFRFLEKPYRPQTLAQMVRECLDANKPGA